MNTSARPLFATHRGKRVKRTATGLFVLAVAMFVISHAAAGKSNPTAPAAAASPIAGMTTSNSVSVNAAVANPFAVANGQASNASGTTSSTTTAAGGTPTAAAPNPDAYASLIQAASTFAAAYATYSYAETPTAWANHLPDTAPGFAAQAAASASATWPQLTKGHTTTTGRLSGAAPELISYDQGANTAEMKLSVLQSVTGGQSRSSTQTYLVSAAASPSGPGWMVTSVQSVG